MSETQMMEHACDHERWQLRAGCEGVQCAGCGLQVPEVTDIWTRAQQTEAGTDQ